jgi:primosomal protein N' (replication factor Y) (superfamily II helicase)
MARSKKSDSARKRPAPRLVDVAVMAAIRDRLTYSVPEGLELRPGQRVQVPLGTRRALGVVIEPAANVAPGIKVREILRALDPEPSLTPELVTLGLWIAEYYLAPVGEVFRAMLPLRAETRRAQMLRIAEAGKAKLAELESSLLGESRQGADAELLRYVAAEGEVALERLRRKSAASPQAVERALAEKWLDVSEVELARGERKVLNVRLASGPVPARPPRLSPAAQRILKALEGQGRADDHRALLKSARASLSDLKKLGDAGLLEWGEVRTARVAMPKGEGAAARCTSDLHLLTPAQESAFADLSERLEKGEFGAVLLHGVTASGKTEIYLRLIARCLERGRAALMLVPEIALTPSVESQFVERFGDRVAVLHSGLSEAERHREWQRARRGEARVILGTRSAVFAPASNLGVVIVDEEHDASYKQQETPRYHGRDVAVVRGRLERALVVLGSATPSLESAENAREGKYRLLKLEERVAGRSLASVEIVDMREEFRQTLSNIPVSRRLQAEIQAQLAARAQTMILLNRRGYAWYVLCRSCGQSPRCVNCSISLTYHRREHRQICHYCGYSAPVPARCPSCGSEHLHFVGEGTEKLEIKFAELFPGARVARLDRDVARRPDHFAKILDDFRQGKIDILVGTQMIAKGHDFPGVTLVGVVSVDVGLSLPDFRSAERTFQLLTQAAGRSGRGDAPGRVLVQTFYPEHYAVRMAAEQNYDAFFSKEMRFRRVMHYPPAAALANVVAQDVTLERAARVAQVIGKFLEAQDGDSRALKILGPSPAPLAKIKGRHRIQFLLKSSSRARLNQVLRRLMDYCDQRGIPPHTVMIDVDPVSIM